MNAALQYSAAPVRPVVERQAVIVEAAAQELADDEGVENGCLVLGSGGRLAARQVGAEPVRARGEVGVVAAGAVVATSRRNLRTGGRTAFAGA